MTKKIELEAELNETVREQIRRHAMVTQGERILAAVSGGPDSVCMLHVLLELGFPVVVAHFDHQTREGESAADADFVRDLAQTLDLPIVEECRPIAKEAAASPLSFEEYAREARYAFFARAARERGCAVIATGHHANDQAETILLRILRGTGPRGLVGIPPVRALDELRVVRPLLACTRADIMGYLAERGIRFQTDRSNADLSILRNHVRHALLPELSTEYSTHISEGLARIAELHYGENDLVEAQAVDFLRSCLRDDCGINRTRFAAGHIALQRRAVLSLGWKYGVECPFSRVEAARRFIGEAPTGDGFDLGGGFLLWNGQGVTDIVPVNRKADDSERFIPLTIPGATSAFGRRFTIRFVDRLPLEDLASYCTPQRQVFDADAVGETLAIRHRRPGDRFTPLGMAGSKKLKDYFVGIGVPVARRDAELLLVRKGGIAWVVGRAIDAHVAVTATTRRIIEVEVENLADLTE